MNFEYQCSCDYFHFDIFYTYLAKIWWSLFEFSTPCFIKLVFSSRMNSFWHKHPQLPYVNSMVVNSLVYCGDCLYEIQDIMIVLSYLTLYYIISNHIMYVIVSQIVNASLSLFQKVMDRAAVRRLICCILNKCLNDLPIFIFRHNFYTEF